ncbi:unnamed protein product, partial [Ectocarpus sp. 4 AP-2014]
MNATTKNPIKRLVGRYAALSDDSVDLESWVPNQGKPDDYHCIRHTVFRRLQLSLLSCTVGEHLSWLAPRSSPFSYREACLLPCPPHHHTREEYRARREFFGLKTTYENRIARYGAGDYACSSLFDNYSAIA